MTSSNKAVRLTMLTGLVMCLVLLKQAPSTYAAAPTGNVLVDAFGDALANVNDITKAISTLSQTFKAIQSELRDNGKLSSDTILDKVVVPVTDLLKIKTVKNVFFQEKDTHILAIIDKLVTAVVEKKNGDRQALKTAIRDIFSPDPKNKNINAGEQVLIKIISNNVVYKVLGLKDMSEAEAWARRFRLMIVAGLSLHGSLRDGASLIEASQNPDVQLFDTGVRLIQMVLKRRDDSDRVVTKEVGRLRLEDLNSVLDDAVQNKGEFQARQMTDKTREAIIAYTKEEKGSEMKLAKAMGTIEGKTIIAAALTRNTPSFNGEVVDGGVMKPSGKPSGKPQPPSAIGGRKVESSSSAASNEKSVAEAAERLSCSAALSFEYAESHHDELLAHSYEPSVVAEVPESRGDGSKSASKGEENSGLFAKVVKVSLLVGIIVGSGIAIGFGVKHIMIDGHSGANVAIKGDAVPDEGDQNAASSSASSASTSSALVTVVAVSASMFALLA